MSPLRKGEPRLAFVDGAPALVRGFAPRTRSASLLKTGYHPVDALASGGRPYAGSNGYAFCLDPGRGRVQNGLLVTDPVGVGDYTTTLVAAQDSTLFVGTHGYVYAIRLGPR